MKEDVSRDGLSKETVQDGCDAGNIETPVLTLEGLDAQKRPLHVPLQYAGHVHGGAHVVLPRRLEHWLTCPDETENKSNSPLSK